MEAADVNNHQVIGENTLVPVSGEQLPDSEEESGVKVETHVSVGQVQLRECAETQLGNRNIYHGTVDVENVIEIIADQDIECSVSPNLPVLSAFERAAAIGANLIAEPVAAAEIVREFNENIRAHQRREVNPLNGCEVEQVPLLSQNDSRRFRTKYITLLIIVSCAICVSVILVITYGHQNENDDDLPPSFTHIYRKRAQWYALAPKKTMQKLEYLPPLYVVISHTGSTACFTADACSIAVRNIQAYQMAGAFNDIAYNFLLGGNGLIYEGRGWRNSSASGVSGMDCSSLDVAFVGNFENEVPTAQQVKALQVLLDTSANTSRLTKNYKMFMMNEIDTFTKSPGKEVINILKDWDHTVPFSKDYFVCS